jgi:ketosteroid isomerase-like protein
MYRVRGFLRLAASVAAVALVVAYFSTIDLHAESNKTQIDTAALPARVEKLESTVAYLEDRQQINDVYLRYMRGFDRNDVELMRSAFWPDAQINYGRQSNSFEEFVVRHLNWHTKWLAHYMHIISNESVSIVGDVAHAETYVTRLSSDGKDGKSMIVAGRYIDRLDRRNGKWRIAVREFIPSFATETVTSMDAYFGKEEWPRSGCRVGTLDRQDPSYLRPLNPRENKDARVSCAK